MYKNEQKVQFTVIHLQGNHVHLKEQLTCKTNFSQHNKEISRPASNNILDLILTNNPSSVSHVYCTTGMSDHNAVICVLNILPQYKRQPK